MNYRQKTLWSSKFPGRRFPLLPRVLTLLLTTFLALASPLSADPFHNIKSLFGERASAMGGAFGGVSDDPSGAFYNPAGLRYSQDNYISLSAANYRENKTSYPDVLGPSQSYVGVSRTYIPNFLGAVKKIDDELVFAFSVLTPEIVSIDQSSFILRPAALAEVNTLRLDETQDYTSIMAGPSIAWGLSDNISLGASLYYFYDNERRISTLGINTIYDTDQVNINQVRRRTMGLYPTLGLQASFDRLTVGLSLRKPIITARYARQDTVIIDNAGSSTFISLTTENQGGAISGNLILSTPGATSEIPAPLEARLGLAYYFNQNFLIAFDFIRTGAYSKERDYASFDLSGSRIILSNPNNPNLERIATNNIALGFEYFLTDSLVFRLGGFTNKASSPDIIWRRTLSAAFIESRGIGTSSVNNDNSLFFDLSSYATPEGTEHIDTNGLTLGVGFADARSSISVNLVFERGKGGARLASGSPSHTAHFESKTIYVVSSTRQ